MTPREYLKLDLMIFAINRDFFGYGSNCYKRKDHYYVVETDGERFIYSAKDLASQWDLVDEDDKVNILDYFRKKELGIIQK